MKAVALTQYLPIRDPRSLFDVELPKPNALGSDILVRVEAVSVNPVDTKVRAVGNAYGGANVIPAGPNWNPWKS